jgi:hypothetical protein
MTVRPNPIHRKARNVLPLAAAFLQAGVSLSQAQEGERVVPIDKVVLGNRLNGAVTVYLLPDLGTYQVAGGTAEEFACAIVKGFALSADGTKFNAECGKRYAVTQRADGLAIIEIVLNANRP